MALSANTERVYELGDTTSVPVKASAVIYLGSAVGYTSGYGRALTAGDDFAGFAQEAKTGTASDGGVHVSVLSAGRIKLAISSIAVTDIGKPVYASDDGTFTLTQSTNSKIGHVWRWVSTGYAIVEFKAQGSADLSGITALTDSTGGSANNTLAAITLPTALTVADGTGTNDGTIGAITDNASTIAAVQELAAFCNAQRTATNVIRDCLSDLAAKVNEILAASK